MIRNLRGRPAGAFHPCPQRLLVRTLVMGIWIRCVECIVSNKINHSCSTIIDIEFVVYIAISIILLYYNINVHIYYYYHNIIQTQFHN
jgi:hypothetical protein